MSGAMAAFDYVVDGCELGSAEVVTQLLSVLLSPNSQLDKISEIDPFFWFGARYLQSITSAGVRAAAAEHVKKLCACIPIPRSKVQGVRERAPDFADFIEGKKQLTLEQVGLFRKRPRENCEISEGEPARKKRKT